MYADKAEAERGASAVALHAALKSIEERAQSNADTADENGDEHSGFIVIRDEARAAIAKAEGR